MSLKRSGMPQRTAPMPRGDKPLGRNAGLQRTASLTAGTPLERTSGIRPVSEKRAAANKRRRAMVARLYPERPLCAVWQARLTIGLPPLPDCTRWADDVHEPLSRARGGSITDEENSSAPCRPCHDVLTFTPESELGWAYELDLLRKSRPSKAVPREAA